jgi:hypothetical protein
VLSENGKKRWRALSHRIFRRRSFPGDGKDKLEISHALTYSTTQLVSSFQLCDQQTFMPSTVRRPD